MSAPKDEPGGHCWDTDHRGLRRMYTNFPRFEKDDVEWMGQDTQVIYLILRRLEEENKDLWKQLGGRGVEVYGITVAIMTVAVVVVLAAFIAFHVWR